jgi:hypothetical protein
MSEYRILESVGFEYGEGIDGSKFVVERGGIVAAVTEFCRTLHSFKIAGSNGQIKTIKQYI